MQMVGRAILAAVVAVMIGGTIALAAGDASVAPSQLTTATEVKGPCDEAEHAKDPRCGGAQAFENENEPRGRHGADDADRSHELERADDFGGSKEIEAADDSGRSTEIEAGDVSGRSGHSGSDAHGTSGRDHAEDD